MIRVASIWNTRPDLGEVQVQMIRKMADSQVEFIVGTAAEGDILKAILSVVDRYDIRLVHLEEPDYQANMIEMVLFLDQGAEEDAITFLIEEDLIPTKRFGWQGVERASAYRGKTLRCWKGQHPELGFEWELIPHIRVFKRSELPTYLRRTIKEKYVEQEGEERDLEAHYMELFDGNWLHYEKGSYPRKGNLSQTKDALWAEICKVYDINPPDKWWGTKEVERDPDELAAHHAHADCVFRRLGLR